MNETQVMLRALDMVGYAAGFPQISMFTKLYEEVIQSQKEMLVKFEKIQNLDKGELLGLIGSGETALANYFSDDEIAEDFRNRQLMRAWSKFNQAYFTLRNHSSFKSYAPRIAKSLAFCHFLMGHKQEARDWMQTAINDNKKRNFPENHEELLKILSELADEKYLPEGQ